MIKLNLFKTFANKFLIFIYILILIFCIYLYKFVPLSKIIITNNKVLTDWPYNPKGCFDFLAQIDTCVLNKKLNNIILFGDSHAGQLVFGFEDLKNGSLHNNQFNLVFLTGSLFSTDWPLIDKNMKKKISKIKKILSKSSQKDIIVFALKSRRIEETSYNLLTGENRLRESLSKILVQIFSTDEIKARIVLMLDTPYPKFNVARICSNKDNKIKSICLLDKDYYISQNKLLKNAYIDAIQNSNILKMNSIIYDPSDLFYYSKKYSLYDESGYMLIDGNHIKASVSKKLITELMRNEF